MNSRWGYESRSSLVFHDMEASTPDRSDVTYLSLQAKGNQAFSSGSFEEAVTFFTKAIEIDPKSHVLYSNRSAAKVGHDLDLNCHWLTHCMLLTALPFCL